MPFTSPTVLDAFTRANENPLSGGGNWLGRAIAADSNMALVSNAAQDATGGSSGFMSAVHRLSIGDGEAFATIRAHNTSTGWTGVFARAANFNSAGVLRGYGAAIYQSGTLYLTRFDGSDNYESADLHVLGGFGFAVGDSIGIACEGTTISSWHKPAAGAWRQIGSAVDATYSSGNIGMFGYSTMGAIMDDFGGSAVVRIPNLAQPPRRPDRGLRMR